MSAAPQAASTDELRGQPARGVGHRPEHWEVAIFSVVVAMVAAYLCAADITPAPDMRTLLAAKRREPKALLHAATDMFPDADSTLYHHNHLQSISKPSPLPNGSIPPQEPAQYWNFFKLMVTGGDARRERVPELVVQDDTEFVHWLASRVGDGDNNQLRRVSDALVLVPCRRTPYSQHEWLTCCSGWCSRH